MPLKYLIDEHLRGKFVQALMRRGFSEAAPVAVLETGEAGGPPLGTLDPDLLVWGQIHERILVSLDSNSMPDHLAVHLGTMGSSPGVFLIRRGRSWDEILYFLVLAAAVSGPEEFKDRCTYLP